MFYLDPITNRRFKIGTPFSYGGAAYPSTSANHSLFISLGFIQVTVEVRPNSTFYCVGGDCENDGTWVKSPRSVDQVKSYLIERDSKTAHQILSSSDWMVYRAADGGIDVPAEWSTYRASVRTAHGTRAAELNAATTIEELETAYGSITAWPEAPIE